MRRQLWSCKGVMGPRVLIAADLAQCARASTHFGTLRSHVCGGWSTEWQVASPVALLGLLGRWRPAQCMRVPSDRPSLPCTPAMPW